VFDTAAVANAVRLLGLNKIYGLWPQVRTVIPLYPREIVGVESLIKLSEDMFRWEPSLGFFQ